MTAFYFVTFLARHRRALALLCAFCLLYAVHRGLGDTLFERHKPSDSRVQGLPQVDTQNQWPPRVQDGLCRPKIFLYDLPDVMALQPMEGKDPLAEGVCGGIAYASELQLYKMLKNEESEASKLYMTKDPTEANFFWVPFFGSCFFTECSRSKWYAAMQKNNSNIGWEVCQADERYIKPLMTHIISQYPYWNKTNGRDHIFVHPMDAITRRYYKPESVQTYMRDAIFITTVGDKRMIRNRYTNGFRIHRDIVIPSATNLLHIFRLDPGKLLDGNGHRLDGAIRDIKVIFRGTCGLQGQPEILPNSTYSHGVRSLFPSFAQLPGWDIKGGVEPAAYADSLSRSRFGLAPVGWTADTTRIWELLAYGVVPVIISDGIVEPFEDHVDWRSFAVFVRRDEAHRLPAIIDDITPTQYERLQKRVWTEGRFTDIEKHAIHYIVRDLCRLHGLFDPQPLAIS